MTPEPSAMRARVHDRGDPRLEGIRNLIAEAGRNRPLGETLGRLCRDIAEIADADVVSVYVLERDAAGVEIVVLRGNVGFPPEAVGRVRLRVGEGLTGLVAECLQPVSLAVAQSVPRYHHVDGLGEEDFPAYLGLPLFVGGRLAGVLVLQRREPRELEPAEVALAASLAAPVGFALERAAQAEAPRRPSLGGRGHGGGTAIGRVNPVPSLDALLGENIPRGGDPGRLAALAHETLARELVATERRLAATPAGAGIAAELRALSLLVEDQALRELIVGACRGAGATDGLAAVAVELGRRPYRVPGSGGWLAERPEETLDLCLLLGARLVGRPLPARNAILVTPRLSGVVALAAVAHGSSGVVVAGAAEGSELGVSVAVIAGLPLVTGAAAVTGAAGPGDQLLVDGHTGRLILNPPAAAIAALRPASST